MKLINQPVDNGLARAMVCTYVYNFRHNSSTDVSTVSVLMAGDLTRVNHV